MTLDAQLSTPMLAAHGLVKDYGSRRVVDGVDFEVYPGEIVGLLGPNGAGKTTTFRMTCGMIEPNAGKVVLGGIDVTRWPMYRRAAEGHMGYLAQESSVFRKLSVEKNLLGVMEMIGRLDARAVSRPVCQPECATSMITPTRLISATDFSSLKS